MTGKLFEEQLKFLSNAITAGSIGHGYLFSRGEAGDMKECAERMASLLLDMDLQKGINPDYTIVSPETESGRIGIEQIQELRSYLSLAPYSAEYKVAVIEEAERMTPEAQAALLKFLEEPKGSAVIILLSRQPDLLLSTIRSRVQEIRFAPIQSGLEPTLYEKEDVIKTLRRLRTVSLGERFKYAAELSEKPEEILSVLSVWLGYLRALLIAETKKGSVHVRRLKELTELVEETISNSSMTNVNARLAIERIMLAL